VVKTGSVGPASIRLQGLMHPAGGRRARARGSLGSTGGGGAPNDSAYGSTLDKDSLWPPADALQGGGDQSPGQPLSGKAGVGVHSEPEELLQQDGAKRVHHGSARHHLLANGRRHAQKHGGGLPVKWEKVLWKRQPFPDNYTDKTFLQELVCMKGHGLQKRAGRGRYGPGGIGGLMPCGGALATARAAMHPTAPWLLCAQ
jgi:hypothetical protein